MKRQYKYSSAILASLIFSLAPTLALLVNGVVISAATAQTATTQNRKTEAYRLNQEGIQQLRQGKFREALETFQKVLVIRREIGDKRGEGVTLNNIGLVYRNLGQYPKALEFYQQALAIRKQVGDPAGEGVTLNNIGVVYRNLGQYPKALEFYQQALAITKQIGDKATEGTTLNNIGSVYDNLGQYPKALEFYQQALAITKQIGNQAGEGATLNNIGGVYDYLGQYPKALEFYQQALAISKEVGDKAGEGNTLNNIGLVYSHLGQYPKALEFYQQALAITKQIGDKATEGTTLNNIGFLLEAQKQPQLAIVFLKQSVSTYEEIRQQLRVLPKEQQESYTKTIAKTYRRLADILLQQDRILEAQQVLDLLKLQEIEDYLRNVRGTGQQLYELPPEREILAKYNELQQSAIALGKELTQLRKIPEASRTSQQQQRIAQLVKLEEDLNGQFNAFTSRADIVALVDKLSPQVLRQTVDLSQLDSLRDDLKRLDAVILYPLVLEDRLELVITTPNSPPLRRTVNVKREDLNLTIAEFRQVLQNPEKDAKPSAQQLYTWLIKPLENDLKQAGVKTIIYSPDAQLRYIPLAALHDGNQWLVQRYRINNITAKSLTDFSSKPQPQPRVLAGAFVQGTYNVTLGDDTFYFRGLTYAGKEVENLVSLIPNSTKLFDQSFSKEATTSKMNEYNIVHMATHAAFVPGDAKNSFILFGDGDQATLKDIENWTLNNVDLVVLSACETGLGGKFGENGEEVLGLGYQFQSRGVRATIASLWQVDDGGTQALMDAFYASLENGKTTKAEALRQAQTALITGDFKPLGEKRGIVVAERIRNGVPAKVQSRLSHPYYWAPFILIGNGL
ncbi:MAG: tetratricopeptide repeat protein [Nostocaceae cyanobacterium]|nr:tetratricopeptide repeat protein [Nostocaceae cyanobacterium]